MFREVCGVQHCTAFNWQCLLDVLQGVAQQAYVFGLTDPAVLDYTLQDVVNIQCNAIPSDCSLPVQSLNALVDALGAAATTLLSSTMRNIQVETATPVSLHMLAYLLIRVYAQLS